MTAVETLRAAAAQLRDRSYFEKTGEPDTSIAFDTALAVVFDAWARMGELDPDLLNRNGGEETIALARLVLGEEARDGRV